MKQNLANNKGVTLVTLVVTIIVLIILAGVSINMLLGENGIITKAKEAAKMQEIATIKEEIRLKILEQELEGQVTQTEIETILSNYGTVNKNEDGTIKSLTPTGKNYEIAYEEIYTSTLVEEGKNDENAGDDTNNGSDSVILTKEEYNAIIERLDAIDGGSKTSVSIADVEANMTTSINNINSNFAKYNDDDDSLDVYVNGVVVGSISCHFKSFNFIETVLSDWTLTGCSLTINPTNLTFSSASGGGGYTAQYNKKVKVTDGKKFYCGCSNSYMLYSGCIDYSSDGTTWTQIVAYNSGVGGTKTVNLPTGEYYFRFRGFSNGTATAVFTTFKIE